MFCPNCSQQVAGETRFCSRCGFPLNVVKALVANETLPVADGGKKPSRSFSKRDMSIGAAFMFLVSLLVAAISANLPPQAAERILLIVVAWLVLTLVINAKPIFQYFVRGDAPGKDAEQVDKKMFGEYRVADALPPTPQQPAASYLAPPAVTSEIGPPPSVTESTTNLLKNDR